MYPHHYLRLKPNSGDIQINLLFTHYSISMKQLYQLLTIVVKLFITIPPSNKTDTVLNDCRPRIVDQTELSIVMTDRKFHICIWIVIGSKYNTGKDLFTTTVMMIKLSDLNIQDLLSTIYKLSEIFYFYFPLTPTITKKLWFSENNILICLYLLYSNVTRHLFWRTTPS